MTEKKDRTNAEKSYTLAKALFPDEEWSSSFIRLLSDLSVGSVKSKIAGELKFRPDEGEFICFFEKTGELFKWTYKELRAIIGT